MTQSRVLYYRIFFLYFAIFVNIASSWAQPAPDTGNSAKRLALVIGNSDYPFLKLPEAVENSNTIAAALIARDFEVMTLSNASEKQMAASLREFARRLGEQGGDGLFYFAGHAVLH